MKLRIVCLLIGAATGFVSGTVGGQAAPDAGWASHCSKNLESRHLSKPAVQTYCSCMAGLGDDDEMMKWDQKQLQKSFPYMHVKCVDKAAKHKDDPA